VETFRHAGLQETDNLQFQQYDRLNEPGNRLKNMMLNVSEAPQHPYHHFVWIFRHTYFLICEGKGEYLLKACAIVSRSDGKNHKLL
jgi:hypothetical protein